MTAKQMLAVILRRAVLTSRERESFEDMYDRIHRFNRCSDKQQAWIEKVYFGQKLDREDAPTKRRVVVPTWQKEEGAARPSSPQTTPTLPTPQTAGHTEPTFVKTNARQIASLQRRRQSDAFTIPAATAKGVQVGYINYPGIQREELVTSLSALEALCPRIAPGSKQYEKIAGFFEKGGLVLKVKPLEAQVA